MFLRNGKQKDSKTTLSDFVFAFSIRGLVFYSLLIRLTDCLWSFTNSTIPWGPTESQWVFFTIVFCIISNGDSVLSSSTSATTKRFISSVLQVSLAYALGCQCCCWKSLSFSYSSTLWFVLYLSCVYLCMWVFISYTKRLRLSNGDMGFEISASKNCSN